ncbi:uncharacterized protein ATC70_001179 [Mucor velutinosus]|uniref:Uncharacterized protein n=1 Tax=Mucor velutinosus TaxID=708070 RepID=A0AAN7DIR6_9FUNG|nr:hypothetical protein ATC70_001179 [Mucor velutinosus]
MEVGVDTDYCLVETDSSGGKSTATAHPEIKRVGIDVNTKIGINTITPSSAATATCIAQTENKGFGAQTVKNLNAELPFSASATNPDSPKTAARAYDANVGVKFAINSTAFGLI